MSRKAEGNKVRKTVRIIGVPMDLGAGRRGVDMGPSAVRIGGLHRRLQQLRFRVEDSGNLEVRIPEELHYGQKRHMYLGQISEVCRRLSAEVMETLEKGGIPLVLGGDHSLAAGSIAGTSAFYRKRKQKIGLLWFDAHTDMNTPETSSSGNVHGMPLAALLGLGPRSLRDVQGFYPKVSVENTIVIGARSIDPRERELIRKTGVRVVTMKELDMRGMKGVMEEALRMVSEATAGCHCSFDLDVVDPQVAPGVGTPVRGGISYRESHLAMEMVFDSGKVLSSEFVEVNPVLDSGNSTGLLAVELICSLLGKKIL